MTMNPNDPRRATTNDPNRLDADHTRRSGGSSRWVVALVAIALVVAVVVGFGLMGTEDTVTDPVAVTEEPANPTVVEDQQAPAVVDDTETGSVETEPPAVVVVPEAEAPAATEEPLTIEPTTPGADSGATETETITPPAAQ